MPIDGFINEQPSCVTKHTIMIPPSPITTESASKDASGKIIFKFGIATKIIESRLEAKVLKRTEALWAGRISKLEDQQNEIIRRLELLEKMLKESKEPHSPERKRAKTNSQAPTTASKSPRIQLPDFVTLKCQHCSTKNSYRSNLIEYSRAAGMCFTICHHCNGIIGIDIVEANQKKH